MRKYAKHTRGETENVHRYLRTYTGTLRAYAGALRTCTIPLSMCTDTPRAAWGNPQALTPEPLRQSSDDFFRGINAYA